MVNARHLAALALTAAFALAGCSAPSGPTCGSDDDCPQGNRCLSSGGVFYGDSYCVPNGEEVDPTNNISPNNTGTNNTTTCSDAAPETACDGIDNNSNGVTDEGCTCAFAGLEMGVCVDGVIDCEGLCTPPADYADDDSLCDGIDNDCDGSIDEEAPFLASAVAAGGSHTCAIDPEGDVYCWGRNNFGQLGNGTMDDSAEPVPVDIDVPVSGIAAGTDHTCAVGLQSGAVYCWGRNDFGQVGTDTLEPQLTPVRIDPLEMASPWTYVATGTDFSCAISAGNIYCWGNNSLGQTGNTPSADPITVPTAIAVDSTIQFDAVDGGDAHACASTTGGDGYCWGFSADNRLTRSVPEDYGPPAPIEYNMNLGEGEILEFATGFDHTCATVKIGVDPLDVTGVICNGSNGFGQLGGTPEPEFVDTNDVGPLTAGTFFACAWEGPQGVTCWGSNDFGQLGRPMAASLGPGRVENLPVAGDNRVLDVSAGGRHACAVLENGVFCWGDNEFGQLGTNVAQPGTTRVSCLP